MSFKKNKYQVIRNAVSKDICDIAYRYLQISAEADYWLLKNNITHEANIFIGDFKDRQVPNSYAKYADRFMETLLIKTIPVMEKKQKLSSSFLLKPGDMIIYSGCELEHWREPFKGNLCGQVFLHYNHANGPFAKTNLFDKRPLLGIPKTR